MRKIYLVVALFLSACGPILPTITPSDTPAVSVTPTYLPTLPMPSTPTPPPAASGRWQMVTETP